MPKSDAKQQGGEKDSASKQRVNPAARQGPGGPQDRGKAGPGQHGDAGRPPLMKK